MCSFVSHLIRIGVHNVAVYHGAARRTLFTDLGGPSDVVVPTAPAIGIPNSELLSLPQDVLVKDLPKHLPELPNAISVDEGIHDGVRVGEDDGNVHHPDVWALAAPTQVVETVDDVQREPAESEQTHNYGQRFGSVHLLLQDRTGRAGGGRSLPRVRCVCHFDAHQSELPPRRHEDVDVDNQHHQQRDQHAAKKIKIDHVV